MRSCLGLLELILGAAAHHNAPVGNELTKDIVQAKHPWLEPHRVLATWHKRQHVVVEVSLQRGELVELVEHLLGIGILFEVDNNTHITPSRLIAQVADRSELLLVDEVGNLLNQCCFINTIRHFCNDDTVAPTLLRFLDGCHGAHRHATATSGVGLAHWRATVDHGTSWKVRPFNVLHEVIQRGIRVVDKLDCCIDHLTKIVGRDVRCHTNGNTNLAIE